MMVCDRPSRRAVRVALLSVLICAAAACDNCSLSVSTGSLPPATVGVRYAAVLNSDCGGDTWFLQTGLLPPGIGLKDNGDLNGIPTAPGIYAFTVGVFDFGSGETAYRGLVIQVAPALPVTATAPPTGAATTVPTATATPDAAPAAGPPTR